MNDNPILKVEGLSKEFDIKKRSLTGKREKHKSDRSHVVL